jgi:DNA-binding transcriptional regulator of glucitol operon
VSGRVRTYLTPGWLAFHLAVLAAVVTMVLLGRWQLDVSDSKHFSLQNFAYALQWWLFSAFALGMWVRVIRDRGVTGATGTARTDAADGPAAQQAEAADAAHTHVPYRRYVMPSSSDAAPVDDPEIAAYNDYLARLAKGERQGG